MYACTSTTHDFIHVGVCSIARSLLVVLVSPVFLSSLFHSVLLSLSIRPLLVRVYRAVVSEVRLRVRSVSTCEVGARVLCVSDMRVVRGPEVGSVRTVGACVECASSVLW